MALISQGLFGLIAGAALYAGVQTARAGARWYWTTVTRADRRIVDTVSPREALATVIWLAAPMWLALAIR